MKLWHMIVVSLLVALMVQLYVTGLGFDMSYLEALAGVVTLKAIAMFLAPEKAPMVFVKANAEEEKE